MGEGNWGGGMMKGEGEVVGVVFGGWVEDWDRGYGVRGEEVGKVGEGVGGEEGGGGVVGAVDDEDGGLVRQGST